MVTCIEVWKIFLVQRDAGTTSQKQFQPVLNVFGFEYNSMIFELEAEHMLTEIFTKMSFVVKKKKKCKSSNWWKPSTKPSKEVKRQEIMEEKVGEKYSFEVQV